MKRILNFMAIAAAVALAFSCAKEQDKNTPVTPGDDTPSGEVDGTLFKASLSDLETKTTIENGTGTKRIVKWAVDDEIAIWWAVDGKTTAKALSAGTTSSFAANVEDAEKYYGVYPAAAADAFSPDLDPASGVDTLKLEIPKVQDGAFAKANIAVAKTAAADKNFSFSNVGSLVRFEVNSSEYTKAVLRGAKGEVLAGKVPVAFGSEGIVLGNVQDAAKSIEVSLNGAGEYYVAILPVKLEAGFSIALFKGDEAVPAAYRTTEYDITRATLLNAGRIDDKIVTDYYASVDGAGTKDGKSEANAFGLAELRDFIRQPLDGEDKQIDGEAYFKASVLDGVTIHFADGVYVLPEAEDGFKLEFTSYPKQVKLGFSGSRDAVLSGNEQYRILMLGNQIELSINGMSVLNGNRTANASEGAGISVTAGSSGKATLNVTGVLFDNNKNATSTSGGAIRCAKGTVNAVNCVFEKDNYARNGGSIYTNNDAAVINCKGCTFKSHSMNTGGAANNSKGTQTYTDCIFDGCYTEGGTGGAMHINAAKATLTIQNCTFKNCRAFINELDKSEGPNDNKASGIISMQNARVNIEGTTFENCYSSAGAVILMQRNPACMLTCNNCLFKNNRGRSRGLIQIEGANSSTQSYGVAFLNNCVFVGNNMATNAWGLIFHGANPTAACFNNCTIYGNTRIDDAGSAVSGGNAVGLNNDGTIILTNSTYISSDDKASIRNTNASNAAILVANSIVINNSSTKNFVDSGNMKAPFNAYNSIMGQAFTQPSTEFNTHTSIVDATEASLAGGQYDAANNVYTWNGPASEFAKMTPAEFETALKSITVNNGNTVINGPLGPAFYNWLSEIGALGKDALGNSRGSAWWPGAWQN